MRDLVIFGAGGQLGGELTRAARSQGWTVTSFTREELDITRDSDLERAFPSPGRESSGLVAVNAAAYTAVDRAETERDAAYAVNEGGAHLVARHCADRHVPLIHFSTDYVFDGTKGAPYDEDDEPRPLNVYGASKLAGEAAVRAVCPQHLILRCSSVFGALGQNFVKTMLRLGREREVLRVVVDQRACPTATSDIASAVLRLVRYLDAHRDTTPFGTYHFTGAPPVTWFEFARAIFAAGARYGLRAPRLDPITAADYPSAARRPASSVLDCRRIQDRFDVAIPDWHIALNTTIGELFHRQGGNHE